MVVVANKKVNVLDIRRQFYLRLQIDDDDIPQIDDNDDKGANRMCELEDQSTKSVGVCGGSTGRQQCEHHQNGKVGGYTFQ